MTSLPVFVCLFQQESRDDESDQSDGEPEAQRRKGPAWVDEDDELEQE